MHQLQCTPVLPLRLARLPLPKLPLPLSTRLHPLRLHLYLFPLLVSRVPYCFTSSHDSTAHRRQLFSTIAHPPCCHSTFSHLFCRIVSTYIYTPCLSAHNSRSRIDLIGCPAVVGSHRSRRRSCREYPSVAMRIRRGGRGI
jgi:hypothetical protein